MNEPIALTPIDLFLASGLVFMAGMVSLALGLRVERRLFVAALRTIVQLSLLGLVLKWIFAIERPWPVVFLISFMIFMASREAVARSSRRYPGIFWDAVLTLTFSALVVGGMVTQIIVGVSPWYHPQYVIPLMGMILGNSLNGVSLALDRFLDHLFTKKDEVELYLAFGATRFEALKEPWRLAVRTGLIPIINAMSVAGVVSLPGMMTGQILAGADPIQAVVYQILVMFMLAGSYALGTALITLWAGLKMIDSQGRLCLEKLFKSSSSL
ncbi:ABC transporter permease [Thermosulfuriphilus sp.]